MRLGVCYYPEQWPRDWWAEDARQMVEMGLSLVRIGEFAWSCIEPEPGQFDWAWLDEAVEVLHRAGLQIVLGTPTATPPKWLVDRHPDMLAVDEKGRPRRFGSRRHYCFSHKEYREACAGVVEALARRYGRHPAVVAWQTDNEYGCHDTTISYSDSAAGRFRVWLADRYGDIEALNRAWGSVFWSQRYRSFSEIDPPNLTVTEANPSHRLDYNRFASDEVASFNRLQADLLRQHSPGRDLVHNFMGFYTEFDHFRVSRDLDVATWDSYPLGFLEQFWFSDEDKANYLRQGHPDIAAFHHDLYRGCGRGRWWVMEQQPGPVNWADYNPAPLAGMVRAWTWEAFAHGAEVVSYFRWRQAPFAQEQMHAGLNRPDRSVDIGGAEARQVAVELKQIGALAACRPAPVALLFDYEADWLTQIQPQGRGFRALQEAFAWYSALRQLGLDVDIVEPIHDLSDYRLVVAPCLPIADERLCRSLAATEALVVLGARAGSKTPELQIPGALPPGPLADFVPLRVLRVESLRPGARFAVQTDAGSLIGERWREALQSDGGVVGRFEDDDGPAWVRAGRFDYLGFSPAPDALRTILRDAAERAGLKGLTLPEGLRVRRRDGVSFAVNYSTAMVTVPAGPDARFLIGGPELPAAGVAAWREP